MNLTPPLPGNSSGNSSTILLETVLQLLSERLKKLSHSGFFAEDLRRYVLSLCASVSTLEAKLAQAQADEIPFIAEIVSSIWKATQFLTGTTSNRVPYEITYLLREVLLDWKLGDCIVTTSLNQSHEFNCESSLVAPEVLLEEIGLTTLAESGHLVQMGVPEIFQHMPLLCSPLYHEVGHFIEEHERLIKRLVVSKTKRVALVQAMPGLATFPTESHERVARKWAIEHFCDLLAASYVGECVSDYIIQWDHTITPCESHPPAASRAEVTRDFLEGRPNALVDLLKGAVADAGQDLELKQRFEEPDVAAAFSDVRPVQIASLPQLHGLLPAADKFIKALSTSPAEFENTNIGRVARQRRSHLINDLIEKSIRSFMIQKAWDDSLDEKAAA